LFLTVVDAVELSQLKTQFYGSDDMHASTTKSFVILGIIFVCALLLLCGVYLSFPHLQQWVCHCISCCLLASVLYQWLLYWHCAQNSVLHTC